KLEHILKDFPNIKICVPHLGFDETQAYRKMIEKYDNLWLDTTMVITDYFPMKEKTDLGDYRSDRVMYGSDFPNIPYAWDRELKELKMADISYDTLRDIANKNAIEFFNIKLDTEDYI
ncbi:MAG: amidohydrolase family protein, partial [bacterium]|nr:amidohydrolase family protein [bacterium]